MKFRTGDGGQMRIRHLGIVTQDLERSAEFYEKVFGFKRLGDIRTPGHYPGKALDLSDGEVNYSLLCPDERVRTAPWAQGTRSRRRWSNLKFPALLWSPSVRRKNN